MENFKLGHASASTWQDAAESCLIQLGELSSSDNLGFLYVTDLIAGELPEILDFFKANTPVTSWVGTVGIGICGSGKQYFNTPAIAVMLGNFPENSFYVFQENENLNQFAAKNRVLFTVAHGDPRSKEIDKDITNTSESLSEGFLVGGLTSSRHEILQIADEIREGGGVSGVIFSNEIEVSTRLTQSCSAIGPYHRISQCDNNIIIGLDDKSALDVFKQDVGPEFTEDLNKVAGNIFAAIPIQGSDTDNYVIRNIIGIDPEHHLLAIGSKLNLGMSIGFTRRDANDAYKYMLQMLNQIKASLNGRKIKGGLYYSCMGRGENLFGNDSKELKVIEQFLGDFPLVGFFANGEIFYQRLHAYSGILTLFLE
ncbi:FIST signal transduction protein [Candidatus Marithrix sp. Canyon 246]|uniref:FIST signal transduction protein n=3 Tax=Candidatus Marithrix sp. Canyon 246 TaxID=1827136 RepID=UPI000849F8CC|nr:FIST C-terminal domain-containing protein [Candidatus Marithrix sp. Canyon 246]